MSDSKAKMLQIRFRLGFRPRPRLGSLSAPPDPLAKLRGQLLKGGDGKGRVSPSPAPQFQNPKTATGRLAWSESWQPTGAEPHSLAEPSELSKLLSYDDSNINIVLSIIIIIIIIILFLYPR